MKKSNRRLANLEFPKAPAALRAQDLTSVRGGDGLTINPCIRVIYTIVPCVRMIEPCMRR